MTWNERSLVCEVGLFTLISLDLLQRELEVLYKIDSKFGKYDSRYILKNITGIRIFCKTLWLESYRGRSQRNWGGYHQFFCYRLLGFLASVDSAPFSKI